MFKEDKDFKEIEEFKRTLKNFNNFLDDSLKRILVVEEKTIEKIINNKKK